MFQPELEDEELAAEIADMDPNPVGFASLGKPDYVIGGMQGAHTVEIMKQLGYSDEQISEIIASGAAEGATGLKPL